MDSHDHRRIGQELDLFHMREEAPGMVFWHPRGWRLYHALEQAVRRHMHRHGFDEVRSPQLLRQSVWEASGHWAHFRDNMFVVDDEAKPLAALKPVSCPGHLFIADELNLSYRDLPLRLGELGLVHRDEQSGALHGLFRLRQFVQDDGHVFCSEDQVVNEVARFCSALREFYAAFGFDDPVIKFASRPPDRLGSDAMWDRAEDALRRAAMQAGVVCLDHPGEGAFYGPKLEFVLEDRLGRAWQCGTIQLDLILAERFDVSYVGADGSRHRPALIHRAVLGSLERFLGIVLEQHEGALPPWLSPDQVVIAPIAERHRQQAQALCDALRAVDVRAFVDARNESLSRRIREAHQLRTPFIAVLGDRELKSRSVSLRSRDGDMQLAFDEMPHEMARRCACVV